MFPDQRNQNNPGYQPPQPMYGPPQQASNGQYQVVPPPQPVGHPGGHNPYEFIVSPNGGHTSARSLLGGDGFIKKIVFILGGGVILIIIAAVLVSALVPSKNNSASLTNIAQRQQEIVRIASVGVNQATDQTIKDFAVNTELGIASSQSQTITYLGTHGTKLSPKSLALDKSSQTDAALAAALSTSTFDLTLQQTLTSQLKSYESDLKLAYSAASNSAVKTMLNTQYTAASVLLQESSTVNVQH